MICLGVVFCAFDPLVFSLQNFLSLWLDTAQKFWNSVRHFLFKYCFFPPLSPSPGIPITVTLELSSVFYLAHALFYILCFFVSL